MIAGVILCQGFSTLDFPSDILLPYLGNAKHNINNGKTGRKLEIVPPSNSTGHMLHSRVDNEVPTKTEHHTCDSDNGRDTVQVTERINIGVPLHSACSKM
jgi:hypothetical protein